jgi:hypothetical protein
MDTKTFNEGYQAFSNISGATYASEQANQYVDNIADACSELEANINAFAGYATDIKQLKGDIQEFWASGTFNIRAILNNSKYRTTVDRSHDYASPDVTSNWGENFGLKALFSAEASAKAQAISHFQRYMEYKHQSGNDISFIDFLTQRGIDSNKVLATDPIYADQTRIIPEDQLKEAISFLKLQIAKKEITNQAEAQRYKDTLEHLTSRITAPDGTQSTTATTKELLSIAEKAKEGEFNANESGFSPEQLIKIEHIVKQGLKSGLSAATITMVLKTAPCIYKCLDELINNGSIDENDLKATGFTALTSSADGFVRGFAAASITAACKSGIWGEALTEVNPQAIGALTALMIGTMHDSFLWAKGSITKEEFAYNLQRNAFVSACAFGGGTLLQLILPTMPFAYLLGNFIGSMVGSFVFVAADNAFMSYCIESGCTFFGLVKQDYTLPDNVLKELGVSLFDYEEYFVDEYKLEEYELAQYELEEYEIEEFQDKMIYPLRRGVIGVRRIGYTDL